MMLKGTRVRGDTRSLSKNWRAKFHTRRLTHQKLETTAPAIERQIGMKNPAGRSIEQQAQVHFQTNFRPNWNFLLLACFSFCAFSASGLARGILRRNNLKTLALTFHRSRIAKLILLISL
jgi:hypothetical protein